MELKGKVAVVTGGGHGIGRVLVDALLQAGAHVAVMDIDGTALRELSSEQPDVVTTVCDVTDPEAVNRAIVEIDQRMDCLDILVNNAGAIHNSALVRFETGGLTNHDLEAWRRMIDVNLNAVFYLTNAVVPRMIQRRTQGVIVNISSICAQGNAGQGAYSAAKAGVNALTASWAKELGPFGIRVAALAPGFTKTEAVLASMDDDLLTDWKRKTPIRRMADPAEICAGVMFILNNDFYTGKVLQLDGGLVL